MVTKDPELYAALLKLEKRVDELDDAIAKKKAEKIARGEDPYKAPKPVPKESTEEMLAKARRTIMNNWPVFERLSQI